MLMLLCLIYIYIYMFAHALMFNHCYVAMRSLLWISKKYLLVILGEQIGNILDWWLFIDLCIKEANT